MNAAPGRLREKVATATRSIQSVREFRTAAATAALRRGTTTRITRCRYWRVMIVKNEARSIVETITSVKSFVDRYTIVDTGSTDGTQNLIREAFCVGTASMPRTAAGDSAQQLSSTMVEQSCVPGEVLEESFVDFSTSRNRALHLASRKSIYMLMLSGDEILVRGGDRLRSFAMTHRARIADGNSGSHGAYNVQCRLGEIMYGSPRLIRGSSGWRYVGVTHELLKIGRAHV